MIILKLKLMNKVYYKKILRKIKTLNSKLNIKFRELLFLHFGKTLKYPHTVYIEITNHCNYRCIMCPNTQLPHRTRRKGFMSFDLYKKIIDEIADKVYHIYLHGFGEPLLHPKFLEFLQYAKEVGVRRISFLTNGSLLTDYLARKLVEIGVHSVAISFEGITKQTHESIDVGSKFERDLENIKRLIYYRRKFKSLEPIIIINSVLVRGSEDEEEIRQFWKNFGVDYINIQYYRRFYKEMEDLRHPSYSEVIIGRKVCTLPAIQLMIYWNGQCAPCCNDYFGDLIIGDVNCESIKEIWNGEKIKAIRDKLLKKDYSNLICNDCPESKIVKIIKLKK